jgi:hypothetical protein
MIDQSPQNNDAAKQAEEEWREDRRSPAAVGCNTTCLKKIRRVWKRTICFPLGEASGTLDHIMGEDA